jgi:TolA-binding protein
LVHEEAADDAAFWTAVCQYEQGHVESATDALREYRKRGGPHEWESGALWLEGLWRGELEQWDQAVAVLEMIAETDPHRAGAQVLLRRWKPLAAAQARSPQGHRAGRQAV